MNELIHFTITDKTERLDRQVHARLPHLSRAQVQALIKAGHVLVNGEAAKPGHRFKGGEVVRVEVPPPVPTTLQPEEMPLDVRYDDDHIIVLNKPAGLVVHPGTGNFSGTLVHGLLAKYPDLAELADEDDENDDRVGIVHRLDKDTSGLMVIARTMEALRALNQQFMDRTVDKLYIAMTERIPKTLTGLIDAPIARDPRNRKRMAVQANGRPAQTQYEVYDVDFSGGQALLRLKLFTGRTHQIRVHLAFIGAPVVGDTLYGFRKRRIALDRHFLHAVQLAFDHPASGQRLTFEAPLPPELESVIAELR
jgi:23S rRNA pseudouridine1911/1915/1917 synthase